MGAFKQGGITVKTMYGLTQKQMADVFQHMRTEYLKEDILSVLEDAEYIIGNKEIKGDVIASRLDLDYIAERFVDKCEFNWDLLENIIEEEVHANEDYILTGKCD